ncbi:bis(5'-nucleosyl)-tetraphosphatase (symmetrical) YqeK [Terrisporobacter vanillatitrophus]|uniref:bis(5'-nucleosyl)-tetraphosphatase (symmetrical) YqeK n=1 Tax=Terrisporobacter vanillatitrophus TaxID=3058402 RepID=UPI003368499D
MDLKQIEKILKEMLPERRLEHSLNVSKCAVKLSEIYKCDREKAEIAGLVHDCAKYFIDEQIEDFVEKFNIELDPLEENNIALSHSVIGSYVAMDVFNINDKEIINAIKYHTTGKENMSLLEKIIYMADLIEEGRNFPRVEELRELTYSGKLDEALILSFNNTIKFVIDNNQLIHPRTVKARNYILGNLTMRSIN